MLARVGRAVALGMAAAGLMAGAMGCRSTGAHQSAPPQAVIDSGETLPGSTQHGNGGAGNAERPRPPTTTETRACPWGHLRCCDGNCAPATECALLACDPPRRTAADTR
ncbi:hypothetical protein GCM10012319_73810 [Comamonas sp. KCTC 72670]|nr:hypothetical protein GCM10012319_73810 [Comamonas sp. KCTC 72670]